MLSALPANTPSTGHDHGARRRRYPRLAFALTLMLAGASCGGGDDDQAPVLTIGADGNVVEVDEVDELAPFDPALQQLIFHLDLPQAEEFVRRFPDSVIIDIRNPQDYAAGHLPGATQVDWKADQELFQLLVGQLPREGKYLVYGSVAMVPDTAAAIALLRGIGFQNLYTFYDSYDAWQAAGLPFEQGPDPDPLPLPDPPEEEFVEGGDPELAKLWEIWRRAEQFVKDRDAARAETGAEADSDADTGAARVPPADAATTAQ